MKIFLDYIPIIFFVIAYKIWGIYIATGVAIGVLLIQLCYSLIKHEKIGMIQWVNLIVFLVFGGATIILHQSIYIKWKVSIVYWGFALALLGMQWFSKKYLLKSLMGKKLTVPDNVWRTLTYAWATFFLLVGLVNVYVIYHYTTEQWVNFKLFGTLGLLIIFCVAQAIYLNKYVEQKNDH
jgi:intracellular septation protein